MWYLLRRLLTATNTTVYKEGVKEMAQLAQSVAHSKYCTAGDTAKRIDFNYENQSEWLTFPGSQSGGKRQSPINIDTNTTKSNSLLVPLQFSGHNDPHEITLKNKGTNITFLPSAFDCTLTNHLGAYTLQEFHFHWGRTNDEGSEHTVNGEQFSSEIHFVHLKEGASLSDTAEDTLSVVAVLCKAVDMPISGVWAKLNPVPTEIEATNLVKNIAYTEFLPKNRGYYHYGGSLTTPLCSEIIQWFVLKETIDIPKEFLVGLRQVQMNKTGKLLTNNFRELQALNNREVYDFSTA